MSTLIFDFDGTIADSMPVILQLFCELTHRSPLSDAEVEHLRQLPIADAVRELHIPLWRIPWLLMRGRTLMSQRLGDVQLFDGMPDALEALHRQGHVMYILSSNSVRNVETFLRLHSLQHYFIRVYGGAGMTGKQSNLRKIMRQNHIAQADALYIGDEVRDIDAASRVGIRDIAVTWGFNGEQALALHRPFALAHKPSELAKILKETK